jgi:hypothetical protein
MEPYVDAQREVPRHWEGHRHHARDNQVGFSLFADTFEFRYALKDSAEAWWIALSARGCWGWGW